MSEPADSSLSTMRISEETTWGEEPSSPNMQALRFRSSDMDPVKETVQSDEITSNRMGGTIQEVGQEAGGSFDAHLSLTTYELELKQFLMADTANNEASESGATAVNVTDIDSVTAATKTYTKSGASFNDKLRVGQLVRMSGFTNAGNNGVKKITSVTATTVVVAETCTDETAPSESRIQGSMLRNGTTKRSSLIEFAHSDVSIFKQIIGARFDTMSMLMAAKALIELTFGVVAKEGRYGTATVANSVAAVTSTPVLNTTKHVARIDFDGTEFDGYLQEFAIEGTNNLATRPAIANKFPVGIRTGNFDASGSLAAYFNDEGLMNDLLDHTAKSVRLWIQEDADDVTAGNVMIVTLPRVFFSEGGTPITGVNADVMANLSWMAERDPTTDCKMQIDLFADF